VHIGYSINQGYLDFMSAVSTSTKAATAEPKGVDFAGSVAPAGTIFSAAKIASRYDFANISPREIDQMARELYAGGLISDRESLALLNHGADFLSLLPGNHYGDEQLAERSDLLGKIEEKLNLAQYRGEPVVNREKLLALLEKLQALASLKKKNSGAPQNARISDRTLTELIAQQERNGGIAVDRLRPIDISKLELISLPPDLMERVNQPR
jgi:hypothetical protein